MEKLLLGACLFALTSIIVHRLIGGRSQVKPPEAVRPRYTQRICLASGDPQISVIDTTDGPATIGKFRFFLDTRSRVAK